MQFQLLHDVDLTVNRTWTYFKANTICKYSHCLASKGSELVLSYICTCISDVAVTHIPLALQKNKISAV